MVNGVGTAGISANVTLLVLKTNYMFTEINAAIYYAADNGADIINMSLGAYEKSFTDGHGKKQTGIKGASTYFQTAINYAYNKGVTVIAAAGNERLIIILILRVIIMLLVLVHLVAIHQQPSLHIQTLAYIMLI